MCDLPSNKICIYKKKMYKLLQQKGNCKKKIKNLKIKFKKFKIQQQNLTKK